MESLKELVTVKLFQDVESDEGEKRQLNDIKGVLVHGPVGIGKSLLVSHVLESLC